MPATIRVEVPGGNLCFYQSNGNFVAECVGNGHEPCILTRRAERKGGAASSTGPKRWHGIMAVWLSRGPLHACKASHFAKASLECTREEIDGALDVLRTCPGGPELIVVEDATGM